MANHKLLHGLTWRQKFTTHMGCLKGCLEYLKKPVAYPWLFGATGQAFVLNIHKTVANSGLTHWNTRMLFDLAPNLGFRVQPLVIGDGYAGWEAVREHIDRGLPCYGLEEGGTIADYFVITGYNRQGYYYSSWDAGGPVPWQSRYSGDIGSLQIFCVYPWRPSIREKMLRDALAAVVAYARTPHGWTVDGDYVSGPSAYFSWAEALETGDALCDGHLTNLVSWYECREMAVTFLRDARIRLPGRCDSALREAASWYMEVVKLLKKSLDLVPDTLDPFDHSARWKSEQAAELLCLAGMAERTALNTLEEVSNQLTWSAFGAGSPKPLAYDRSGSMVSLN